MLTPDVDPKALGAGGGTDRSPARRPPAGEPASARTRTRATSRWSGCSSSPRSTRCTSRRASSCRSCSPILLDFLLSPRGPRAPQAPHPGADRRRLVDAGLLGGARPRGLVVCPARPQWLARAPESVETVERQAPVAARSGGAGDRGRREGGAPPTEVEASDAAGRDQGAEPDQRLFGGTTAFLGAATVVDLPDLLPARRGRSLSPEAGQRAAAVQGQEDAVTIARETEAQISAYLFTMTSSTSAWAS